MTLITENFEVVVVGGGASGYAAAILIADLGFRTAHIAPPAPRDDRRTTALLGGSIELLDRIGVRAALEDCGASITTMRLVDATGRLVRAPEVSFNIGEIGRESFGLNIPNVDLLSALAKRTVTIGTLSRLETTVVAAMPDEQAIILDLADGRRISGNVAVAADGRKSLLREAAGIEIDTWDYPQTALVATLRAERPHRGICTEFHGPNGPFVLVPLPGNHMSIVLVERPSIALELDAMDDAALGRDLERRSQSIHGRLSTVGDRQVYPLSGMSARRLAANRTLLVGEAAHVFPPFGAQGLNLGLRDVAHAAEVLVKTRRAGGDIGGAPVMTAYDRLRRPDVKSRTAAVDLMDRFLLSDALPAQAARAIGMSLAGGIVPLRRFLMREGLTPTFGAPRIMRRLEP